MLVPNRHDSLEDYRYGFQGQEKDDELKGEGNSLNYTFRMHDPRVGRFFATDPLAPKYPFYSPYQFSGNRVIDMVELEGLEPTESGSYAGQGAIDSQRTCEGEALAGTEDTRWIWNQDTWNYADFNVRNSQLTSIFPKGKSDALVEIEKTVNLKGSTYGISSDKSLAHFLSQAGHEVGGFSKGLNLEENLNYSVDGLVGTFDKYFYKGSSVKGKLDASLYGYIKNDKGKTTQSANKEGIANQAYGGRMGNTGTGDGYKFRGRGIFQLTGKNNYSAFNTFLNDSGVDILANPSLISTSTEYSIKSAMWFFKTQVVDKLNIQSATVKQVTNNVNGGTNGLDDRQKIYNEAIEKL
jgi:RHS repeat-associated protein